MKLAHIPAVRVVSPLVLIASLLLSACATQGPDEAAQPEVPFGTYPLGAEEICRSHLAELKSTMNEAADGILYDLNDPGIQERLTRPVATFRALPNYPMDALRRGQGGEVTLAGIIERGGTISNIRVLISESVRGFDEAAVESFQQWRFEPARIDGRFVHSYLCTRIRFNLVDV